MIQYSKRFKNIEDAMQYTAYLVDQIKEAVEEYNSFEIPEAEEIILGGPNE